MSHQNIAILGATGNIAEEFAKQIAQKDVPRLGRHENPTNIIAMADRSGIILNTGGIEIQNDPELIAELQGTDRKLAEQGQPRTAFKNWLRAQPGYQDGAQLKDLFDQVVQQGLIDDVVFVDLTASDLTSFHQQIIEAGGKIVTANKIPVAQSSWEVFKLLTRLRRRYAFSCSVMAGAGAVPFLQKCFDLQDKVISIEGCFSGTLGKLCNLLYKGEITFSEAIRQLKVGGDTEPDPRDDLSGMDVARKIVVLARAAGYPVDLKDATVKPFIPDGFGELAQSKCSTEEFMAECSKFDGKMSDTFREARDKGKTLRYVATLKLEGEKPKLTVGLREEELDSSLGSLKGNANKVVIFTDTNRNVPWELSAAGSGIRDTAKNVRGDLRDIQTSIAA
ncbi:MAG: hypothetical protein WC269_00035 [Candidatus Gracilibacteria bacterium]|jgi:aspartokinase/homoserine dehydrogenase 1